MLLVYGHYKYVYSYSVAIAFRRLEIIINVLVICYGYTEIINMFILTVWGSPLDVRI